MEPNEDKKTENTTEPIGISDALDRLMAHPELISMVASAIGLGSGAPTPPMTQEASEKATEEASAAAQPQAEASPTPIGALPDNIATLAPLLGMLSGKHDTKDDPKDDHRACLLRALKPYVSHNRCEAIDTIIQISRISDLLRYMH